jgi:exonuclease III
MHHSTHMNRDRQQLRIIQYNVQKSYPVINTLLKDPRVLDYTVICIQEPWLNGRNSKQTHNPMQGNFEVFIIDGTKRPFIAFFVNKNCIGSRDVKVSGRGPFHATIKIITQIKGRKEEIVIYNVYNPIKKNGDPRHREGQYKGITTNSALLLLESALEKYHGKEQLVVGDFNIHHNK